MAQSFPLFLVAMLISRFDPWKSKLCTCPKKLTLNPYTGCPHQCLYCYVSSYVPHFFNCRPKKNLIQRLRKEAPKLKGELVSLANSSDPYPQMEEKHKLTRECLHVLSTQHCKLQIVTKSPLVTRDIDILQKTKSMVSISITTNDDQLAKRLEPRAPPPSKRLAAVEKLLQKNLPTSVRIDPIIPFLNDKPAELVKQLASIGVPHVTCSTYKAKPDNWDRLAKAFPDLASSIESLYFVEGNRIGRSFYLERKLRKKILESVKTCVEDSGMKFSVCREGYPQLSSAVCDGSWLISDSVKIRQ